MNEYGKVDGLCEANSYERLSLWKEFKEQGWEQFWKQESPGTLVTVARLNNRLINVSLSWVRITRPDHSEKRICFWEPVSELVDYKRIRKWLNMTFPGVPQITDALNFHTLW